MSIEFDPIPDVLRQLGYQRFPVAFGGVRNQSMNCYAYISPDPPVIEGICKKLESHELLVQRISWSSGPVVLEPMSRAKYGMFEHFFCLESPDMPIHETSLRDYFDYGIESFLLDRFAPFSPRVGPTWYYIYECKEFQPQLKQSALLLSSPLVGSMLMSYSDDVASLVSNHTRMKETLAERIPLPMVWAFPEEIPRGAIDNIYDSTTKKWYIVSIHSDFSGAVSLMDYASAKWNNGIANFIKHDFVQGTVENEKVSLQDITLHFVEVNGKFRSKRKLSRLAIAFG